MQQAWIPLLLSLKVAGERFGVSKAWASRLHAKTLAQLARSLSAEAEDR